MQPIKLMLGIVASAAVLTLVSCGYKGSSNEQTAVAPDYMKQASSKPSKAEYPRKHSSVGLYIQQSSQEVMERNVYVTCLDGIEYWVVPREGLAPRIDRTTLQPALCEPKT